MSAATDSITNKSRRSFLGSTVKLGLGGFIGFHGGKSLSEIALEVSKRNSYDYEAKLSSDLQIEHELSPATANDIAEDTVEKIHNGVGAGVALPMAILVSDLG